MFITTSGLVQHLQHSHGPQLFQLNADPQIRNACLLRVDHKPGRRLLYAAPRTPLALS